MIGVATPMFFLLPRVTRAGLGIVLKVFPVSAVFRFSKLGAIGSLKQNDSVVMRVKLDSSDEKESGNLHWRGIALDYFDNKTWSKSKNVQAETFNKGNKDFVSCGLSLKS
jgi:hypothetical protein